ncbi:Hypothetical predicted protein [Podarcis lilfordi]|uniref:Uncharacterized protein n=1 Tax=Podarcis lilfordi TaxID=74358 RepID=A0AA35PHK0_9SAUR|nr:Hypothetical predicted protein [Podarcis lilfordi]
MESQSTYLEMNSFCAGHLFIFARGIPEDLTSMGEMCSLTAPPPQHTLKCFRGCHIMCCSCFHLLLTSLLTTSSPTYRYAHTPQVQIPATEDRTMHLIKRSRKMYELDFSEGQGDFLQTCCEEKPLASAVIGGLAPDSAEHQKISLAALPTPVQSNISR